MTTLPDFEKFDTPEELDAHLREHIDDIDSVVIPLPTTKVVMTSPTGERRVLSHAVIWIKKCGGDSMLLHPKDAERLINDGILQRLGIKCVFDTLTE